MNPDQSSPTTDNSVPSLTPDDTGPNQETAATQASPQNTGQVPQHAPTPPANNTAASADTADPGAPNLFDQIVEKIIEQQEAIIGPVAVEQAKKVHELKIDWPQHDVDIEGNPQAAIDELVAQYKELFGQIAVQVSREAVAAILAKLPADQQPKSLQ